MKNNISSFFGKREIQLLIIIIIVGILFSFRSDIFFSGDNARLLMYIISIDAIVAAGMTILMVSGGFDLSVGSVLAVTGMFLGLLLVFNFPILFAIFLTILLGLIIGFINGIIIAKLNVSPFLLTLGGFFLYRGLAYILGNLSAIQTGKASISGISGLPEAFNNIGGGCFYGIEYIVFYMIPIVIIFHILLINNVQFRQNFNIGGNELASKLAGIKVDRIKILNYSILSVLVAIAAILRTSRMTAAAAGAGEDMPLIVISAVVIGGGSIAGGRGSVVGSFLGIVLINMIRNGLVIVGISPYYEKLYVGLFLLGTVLIDEYVNRSRKRIALKTRA